MSVRKDQSAIREARDQLFLDTADGARLNALSANLGMDRPIFGFSDDTWRAIVKSLALQYKQIKTKFKDVLDIMFGPKQTVFSTLAQNVAVGDRSIFLNSTVGMPQLGFITLDEGTASEETLEYCFINRTTGEVFFADNVEAEFSHTVLATDGVVDALVLGVDPSATRTFVVVKPSVLFSDPLSVPYPINLYSKPYRRAVTPETVSEVTDYSNGILTITGVTDLTEAPRAEVTLVKTYTSLKYSPASYLISLDDASEFPEEGHVLLGANSGPYAAVSGTVNSVTAGAGTFTDSAHVGHYVVFTGNVTSALEGEVIEIATNDATTLNFVGALPAPPAAGDEFSLRVAFDTVSGTVNDVTAAAASFTEHAHVGSRVLFEGNNTSALAGKVFTIQANDTTTISFLETLPAPPVAGDRFYLLPIVRYSRADYTANSLVLKSTISDVVLNPNTPVELLDGPVVSLAAVQVRGKYWEIIQNTPRRLELYIPDDLDDIKDLLSASYIHTAYIDPTPATTVTSPVTAGDTTIDVADSSDFPFVGVITIGSDQVAYYVIDGTTLGIPETSELLSGHAAATAVTLYQPRHGTTNVLEGSHWTVADTFPGPYLYSAADQYVAGTLLQTDLAESIPGPTRVSIDQEVGRTALEVEDATLYPLTGFPYSIRVGRATGNNEVIAVNGVTLKQRIQGLTVANASTAGDTEIELSALQAFAADGATLPNSEGYRVRIGRGTANDEVVYVLGTLSGPDRITVQNTNNPHGIGESVELVADVLSTGTLTDFHNGILQIPDRPDPLASKTDFGYLSSELVEFRISELDLNSVSGLPTTGGDLYLNFGGPFDVDLPTTVAATGGVSTTLTFADSSDFPTVYPFKAIVAPNTAQEEVVLITGNTGTVLEVGGGVVTLRNSHAIGTRVVFEQGEPELITYDSISGNTLSFSPPIVVKSSHQLTETAIPSLGDSIPRDSGHDYPLRMPPSLEFRLNILFDWIRAAGVSVSLINQR